MAVVASEAPYRFRHGWADLIGCIGKQRVSVFDELSDKIIADPGYIGSHPLREIDCRWPRRRVASETIAAPAKIITSTEMNPLRRI